MEESALTWEAFRLTSKSPSELMHILGPHGVDHLIRQAMAAAWRDLPAGVRTLPEVRRAVQAAFNRNIAHWRSMKKATPAEFFLNLSPHALDGYFRQALVLCHMMLPRGKRSLGDVQKIVTAMYERNLAAWDEDYRVLSNGLRGKLLKKKATVVQKKRKVKIVKRRK